jgi:hypothetical protein
MSIKSDRDKLRDALEIICDTASTEWQESDGSRKGAIDNRGERLYFVSKELIEEGRALLAALDKVKA